MSDEQNEFLFTEIYVDTAEIVPIKFSLRFTFDIGMQVLFSRQFLSLRFTCPGGCPGRGVGNGSDTPPVQREQSPQLPRQCAAEGTLRGIQGHRRQRSQKVKQHVRKRQSQSSSCALLKVSAYVTKSYLSV